MEYLCHKWPHKYVLLVVNSFRSFPHLWLIAWFVTRLTRRVSLVEQILLTLPEHLRSPRVFSGVRVIRSLVLGVCFVNRCLSFCPFSFGHCIVGPSSFYGFWLPLWFLQTFHLVHIRYFVGRVSPYGTCAYSLCLYLVYIPRRLNYWPWLGFSCWPFQLFFGSCPTLNCGHFKLWRVSAKNRFIILVILFFVLDLMTLTFIWLHSFV